MAQSAMAITMIQLSLKKLPHFIYDTADGSVGNGYYYNFCFMYTSPVQIDSSALPIVVIETNEYGYGVPEEKQKIYAHMGIINNGNGRFNKPSDPYTDYNGIIHTHVRGNLSTIPPKLSYALETQDESGNNNNVSLLGMPEENDWILYGPYIDKSLIRNELVFELGRKLNYYEPRTRFCELILNGQNQGLYVLTEKIKKDKNRVNVVSLNPDENERPGITGGYVFKLDHAGIIEIIYPKEEDLTQDQFDYMHSYYNSATDVLNSDNFDDPSTGFRRYIDQKSLIDFILMTELSDNFDSYLGSVYMYKNIDTLDGKITFGPWWDYDLAFIDYTYDMLNDWRYVNQGFELNIERYFQDTAFTSTLIERWQELRSGPYQTDSIKNLIDHIIDPIQPCIDRNYRVWPSFNKPVMLQLVAGKSYDEEIALLKSWIKKRALWMDENLPLLYPPLSIPFSGNNSSGRKENYLICYPNPFIDRLKLEINVSEPGLLRVSLFDMTGRTVYSGYEQKLMTGLNRIELHIDNNLMPGFYIMEAWFDNELFTQQKVVKRNP
jgi:hypothetical protein